MCFGEEHCLRSEGHCTVLLSNSAVHSWKYEERVTMSDKQAESYSYDFCDHDHPAEVLDALRQFYIGGLFTDVTLKCGSGQVFHCHKAVLSARSPYFKIMFTADMRERSKSVIKLTGIDCDVLGVLVNYMYSARVCITESNVQSLLEAADLLQLNSVKQACEEFLVRFLDVDNCLGMHAFAQLHVCPALEREARRVMLSRFMELIQEEEFLELDREKMQSVLAAQSLAVWKDEVLIDAVAKWVTHDFDNRVYHVSDLLHSIHFDLDEIYFKTAVDVYRQCLLSREGKIKSTIIQALRTNCKEMSVSGRKLSSSMYIIGGYYWQPLPEVHIWDPMSDSWLQGKDMPDHTRESYSVSLLGANIYVTGGYTTNTVEAVDTVSVYNCDYDEWTEGCPMITARYYHCSVALHGCIYAIGGYRGGAPESKTEFYDPLKKKWFPVASMIQGVGNATACVMEDKIYVTGGHYGYRGSCTYEKIQVYSSDINEWSIVTVSPHPEYGLCSVSLDNKLYLVGGQTTIADCYDTERNEWRSTSVMKERRMECGAVVINGCIYVTGGYSYSKGTYLQSIEKYDPALDSWEIVGTLPTPARSHGCVCVYSV
ncbi:kelch-like protein 23 isoform X2 [Myripristis murdjan]|uniref:kelch-like protein 23 isoform X2 n=1 Tax=Myripristis murdjan TaxID=586833 RepID=UPI001175F830|nr:kelch-like protein 23 isoform X2 [Myripristis murdjan]